jgi:hypothetical protein
MLHAKRGDMRRAEATPEPRLPKKGVMMNPGKSLEAEEALVGEEVGEEAGLEGRTPDSPGSITPAPQVSVWIVMTPFTLVIDGCSLARTI